ncbi:UDP-2,3-diacylglucosamine diphosphatase [Arenimonas sp.]|uniref:UDP-2,3-diacylglucosamine diphosphatase n=1 Tax=Arenimonas sp. TaxID=1872635 RepID=UPI0039E4A8AE
MSIYFVSDLHLDAERPAITELFLRFLRGEARQAEALYILGDLFEAWVGDDESSEPAPAVRAALRELTQTGVPLYLMRGNRDFLYGARFAEETGACLLPDPAVISLYGEPVLLMHGDLLCTDDKAYQAFRNQVRDPSWQSQFLSQPLAARQAFARQARMASRQHQQGLKEAAQLETIADVNADAVAQTLRRYGVARLIHGHTHRPAIHSLHESGATGQRIVLGDWYEQGSVLRVDADGFELAGLPLANA